jgi:hypothetical protein
LKNKNDWFLHSKSRKWLACCILCKRQ